MLLVYLFVADFSRRALNTQTHIQNDWVHSWQMVKAKAKAKCANALASWFDCWKLLSKWSKSAAQLDHIRHAYLLSGLRPTFRLKPNTPFKLVAMQATSTVMYVLTYRRMSCTHSWPFTRDIHLFTVGKLVLLSTYINVYRFRQKPLSWWNVGSLNGIAIRCGWVCFKQMHTYNKWNIGFEIEKNTHRERERARERERQRTLEQTEKKPNIGME